MKQLQNTIKQAVGEAIAIGIDASALKYNLKPATISRILGFREIVKVQKPKKHSEDCTGYVSLAFKALQYGMSNQLLRHHVNTKNIPFKIINKSMHLAQELNPNDYILGKGIEGYTSVYKKAIELDVKDYSNFRAIVRRRNIPHEIFDGVMYIKNDVDVSLYLKK